MGRVCIDSFDCPTLSFTQKLRLKVFGHVSVGTRMKDGWKRPIEHFVFKCRYHGLQIDYPHGFREELRCPICEEVFLNRDRDEETDAL